MRVRPLAGLPEISAGDRLGELIAAAAAPRTDEIVVVSQKVVSKAEGRVRLLEEVTAGDEAVRLAEKTDKDPRLVELALNESRAVIRAEPGVLICETGDGWICANAGIDASNTAADGEVTLLPDDADASARRIRAEIRAGCGESPAVVVADSFGRPGASGRPTSQSAVPASRPWMIGGVTGLARHRIAGSGFAIEREAQDLADFHVRILGRRHALTIADGEKQAAVRRKRDRRARRSAFSFRRVAPRHFEILRESPLCR